MKKNKQKVYFSKLWIYLLFFVYIFFITQVIRSQSITRHQSVAAYIFNFAKNIEYPNNNNQKEFNITVISDKGLVYNELEKISKTADINGRKIIVNRITKPDLSVLNAQLVYLSEEKNSYFMDLFDLLEKSSALLVTENYQNKKLVMINLYDTDNNKLLFEINKSNIDNQQLKLNDELLLTGGSLIDVAELYKNSQKSLRSLEKEINNYATEVDSLKKITSTIIQNIEIKNSQLKSYEALINSQKNEINNQLLKTEELNKILTSQQQILSYQKDSIFHQANYIKGSRLKLNELNEELLNGKKTLNEQLRKISKMDEDIKNKTTILEQQGQTILKQKQYIYLFIIIMFLVIVLSFVIYKAYRTNRKKNMLLNKQKSQISNINHELQASNEELKSTNEELNSTNEELTVTLDKLKETQKKLIQSEKMASLGVLTAGIAHEMNNPINFVYAGVNCLKKDLNDIMPIFDKLTQLSSSSKDNKKIIKSIIELKERYSFVDAYGALVQTIGDIKIGADRTAEIVKGLSNFSRIEKEEMQIVDINNIINETLILLKNKFKPNITIEKNYKIESLCVECYYGKLSQAFLNLLSNAIDSIEGKGFIYITTNVENNYAIISIKDTGCGIDDEIKNKIYDPFYTTKQVGKGVGLGLSITYSIIKDHNGYIDFNSKIDEGTEFIVSIPTEQIIASNNIN